MPLLGNSVVVGSMLAATIYSREGLVADRRQISLATAVGQAMAARCRQCD